MGKWKVRAEQSAWTEGKGECNQFFLYNCSLELSTCFQGQEEAVIKIIKRILSQRHSVVIGMGKIGAIKRVMQCL